MTTTAIMNKNDDTSTTLGPKIFTTSSDANFGGENTNYIPRETNSQMSISETTNHIPLNEPDKNKISGKFMH